MSAFPSHSSNPANSAARGVGCTAAQLSEETACNMMQVAENLGERFVNLTNVGPSALYALAAPSTLDEVRDGVAVRAAAAEKITIQDLSLDEIHVGLRHRHDTGGLQARGQKVASRPQFSSEARQLPSTAPGSKRSWPSRPITSGRSQALPNHTSRRPRESLLPCAQSTRYRAAQNYAPFRSTAGGLVSREYAATL